MRKMIAVILALAYMLSMSIAPVSAVDLFDGSVNEELSMPLIFEVNGGIDTVKMAQIEEFISTANMTDPEISETEFIVDEVKIIHDFAGNIYYDIECAPSGYFIYCPETDTYMEYSYYSVSPYYGYYEYLYYAGVLEYYVYLDGDYYNPVTESNLEYSDVETYAIACDEYYTEAVSQYREQLMTNAESITTAETLSTSGETYVSCSGFFKNLDTKAELGYNSTGVCGYIAAGLLLLYYDCFLCDGIISDYSVPLSDDGKAFVGDAFTKTLRGYGSYNDSAATSIPTLQGIDEVIETYLRANTNCSVTESVKIISDIETVAETIRSTSRPVIVYGSMLRPDYSERISHAVVAYGCKNTNTHLIVNFGHAGYSQVYLHSNNLMQIGSTYRIASFSGTDEASAFTDIGAHWARKDINRCLNSGLMNGVTTTEFQPSGTITRGMLVTVLYRLAGSPSVAISHPFTDVSSSRYYARPISWAYNNGIVNGTSTTEFSPDDPVTRSHAVRIIYRFATEYMEFGLTLTSYNQSNYPEISTMSGETLQAWNWAIRAKVVTGTASGDKYYLYPNNTITRAEYAAMINRLLGNAGVW